ncbi:MAG TPA: PilT/PilU family type 4a pilus ATPase [Actinomycetota bacterium]|nr:PilT/PilU family type 4a pilus ATPase [Actinomycetota bacterium]
MAQVERQLGDVLVEQGVITHDQLRAAVDEEARTGESAWKTLLVQGALSERDLVRGRAAQFGLDFSDVTSDAPTPEALKTVPEDVARRQVMLPLRVENGRLVVAMAEPTNHHAIQEVARATGHEVVATAAYRHDLVGAIDRSYKMTSAAVGSTPGFAPAMPGVGESLPSVPPLDGPHGNGHTDGNGWSPEDSAPITGALSPLGTPSDDLPMREVEGGRGVEVVEEPDEEKDPNLAEFLYAVIDQSASDLHLTAGLPPMLRVDGELRRLKGFRSLLPNDLQQLIFSILTQKQRETFEEHLELDLSYSLPGKARFRVNVFQQRDAVGAVMRMIPFEVKDLDALGLPPAVKEFATLRRGLVLVTGVTGSGKSTTLAGLIDIVNSTRSEHIMTVEDPIEFLHRHKKSVVNQREVGNDTHGFAAALKHVLRQDPDIILVGELRDLETISTALTAAETGHLVFATLHTQDAPQSVDRLIDVFPPHQQEQIRIQLAGTIAGIVSQQLLPLQSGKGRAVAAEVLVATPAVRNLIREGKSHQIYTSMQAGGKFGMQVMDQHLAQLVKSGRVSYHMALERCHKVEEFNRLVGKE